MTQWQIFVLGVLRLNLNTNYDRILELANQHKTIREMLGHSGLLNEHTYKLTTLKDNVGLLTSELLDRINQEIVRAGHKALKKSPEDGLIGRCDSFVVETHVHFPTDINLLLDAIRKVIEICSALAEQHHLSGWRQHPYHQRKFKAQYRFIQRLRGSTSKKQDVKEKKAQEIKDAYQDYLDMAEAHLIRAEQTVAQIAADNPLFIMKLMELECFMSDARRQIDQTDRRVLHDEKIPHSEKVFSLFQPHTEWICKGKAGVPMELGMRVCIMEDSHRFILHHQVMKKTTDDKVAVSMVEETKQRFPMLNIVSMDKGFHSKANQIELKQRLDLVVLPKKGRCSIAEKASESEAQFVRLRKQHAGVESSINALEVHGLDKCLDHGEKGFERDVALAVVARNIHRLGAVLKQIEFDKENNKRGSYKKAA